MFDRIKLLRSPAFHFFRKINVGTFISLLSEEQQRHAVTDELQGMGKSVPTWEKEIPPPCRRRRCLIRQPSLSLSLSGSDIDNSVAWPLWKSTHCQKPFLGCRHSSVDSSAPTILPHQVQVPSTPSMLLSLIVKFVLSLSCEKNEINKKRPDLTHLRKKHLFIHQGLQRRCQRQVLA